MCVWNPKQQKKSNTVADKTKYIYIYICICILKRQTILFMGPNVKDVWAFFLEEQDDQYICKPYLSFLDLSLSCLK